MYRNWKKVETFVQLAWKKLWKEYKQWWVQLKGFAFGYICYHLLFNSFHASTESSNKRIRVLETEKKQKEMEDYINWKRKLLE